MNCWAVPCSGAGASPGAELSQGLSGSTTLPPGDGGGAAWVEELQGFPFHQAELPVLSESGFQSCPVVGRLCSAQAGALSGGSWVRVCDSLGLTWQVCAAQELCMQGWAILKYHPPSHQR